MPAPSPIPSRNRLQSPGHILRELGRLLRSWWGVDRIRVSPTDGELLRLKVHTLLQLDGVWWTVQTRWVGDNIHGPFVRYQCGNGTEAATLEVQPSPPSRAERIAWITGTISRELHPAEITVYEITQ